MKSLYESLLDIEAPDKTIKDTKDLAKKMEKLKPDIIAILKKDIFPSIKIKSIAPSPDGTGINITYTAPPTTTRSYNKIMKDLENVKGKFSKLGWHLLHEKPSMSSIFRVAWFSDKKSTDYSTDEALLGVSLDMIDVRMRLYISNKWNWAQDILAAIKQ